MVTGDDLERATRAGLALARAAASRRRTFLIDLAGVPSPGGRGRDPDADHGIVEALEYGISLERVATADDGHGVSFVRGGLESPNRPEVLQHRQWPRLIAQAKDRGALLLIVADTATAGIERLVRLAGGVIIAGDSTPLPGELILGRWDATARAAAGRQPEARRWLIAAPLAAAAAGLLIVWQFTDWGARFAPDRDLSVVTAGGGVDPAGPGEAPPIVVPAPDDGEPVAAYAIELMATNTAGGAIFHLRDNVGTFPAATFAPVALSDGAVWFKLLVGAASDSAAADSLLARLRADSIVHDSSGRVVALPYALLLHEAVPADRAAILVRDLIAREVPAYALGTRDGRQRIYAGAFASPDQAALLAESLRTTGIPAVLRYRTGRTF